MLRLALPRPAQGGLRLLCIGAHADDIEIGCGGTILRLVEDCPGMSVRWVVLSGDRGRRQEAEASALAFLHGVEVRAVELLEFRDGFFPSLMMPLKEAFEHLRQGFDPSLILTHFEGDRHQDHRVAAELTYNTFRDHLIWEYEIPKYDGDLGNPNLFSPLAPRFCERKVDIILRHFASQRDRHWFTADAFMGLMRLRGINARSPSGFAEAFHCRKALI